MLPFLCLFDLRELHQGRTLLKLCHIYRYHSIDCVWRAAAGDFSALFYLFYCMFLHRGGKKKSFNLDWAVQSHYKAIGSDVEDRIHVYDDPTPMISQRHATDPRRQSCKLASLQREPEPNTKSAKGHNLQVRRLLIWCGWSALKKDTIHLQWCRGST